MNNLGIDTFIFVIGIIIFIIALKIDKNEKKVI